MFDFPWGLVFRERIQGTRSASSVSSWQLCFMRYM